MVKQRGQGRVGSCSPCPACSPAMSHWVQVPSTGTPSPTVRDGGNCKRNFCRAEGF